MHLLSNHGVHSAILTLLVVANALGGH